MLGHCLSTRKKFPLGVASGYDNLFEPLVGTGLSNGKLKLDSQTTNGNFYPPFALFQLPKAAEKLFPYCPQLFPIPRVQNFDPGAKPIYHSPHDKTNLTR